MHTRRRHIQQVLEKRSRMLPVLGLLGPRQVGKSTFLITQWKNFTNATYLTFDEREVAVRAKSAPAQLLISESQNQQIPLIIDEAQKVPHIFDSIKAVVDKNRRMGAFTLSGSVEFSSKSGVRESLAGRIGITKLYPMTIRELNKNDFIAPWVSFTFDSPASPKSIETWLERGGMPIFCTLSDVDERIGLVNSWMEAICYKDLKQLQDGEYDSELAYQLMIYLANKSDSPISHMGLSNELGASRESIKKHLNALEALFLIYKIPAFKSPRAHAKYIIFDAGVLNALQGGRQTPFSRHTSLLTLLINEIYAQYEYAGKLKPNLYYYRTKGGAEIDWVLETREKLVGIECFTSVDITPYRLRGMKSFLKNNPTATGYLIAPVQTPYLIDENIYVIPWNYIA